MVATDIEFEKIKHSMLCVTGEYLRDVTNRIVFTFAFECESSEHLLFLFRFLFTVV